MRILDAEPSFLDSCDGLIIRKDQAISSDVLEETQAGRSRSGHEGEFMHVATIPTIVVEIWRRQGFDINQATSREIKARLERDNLGAFIATSKRV